MKQSYLIVALLFAVLVAAPAGCADEMKAEFDCSTDSRVFRTHFGRYGYDPKNCIIVYPGGIRFALPAAEKVKQTGLYSKMALAGDFEVSAVFDWDSVEMPQGGYGVSCGIAVEALDTGFSVSLARGYVHKTEGPGYLVSLGEPGEKGTQYKRTHYPTRAKNGRLVLRREKNEIVCLVADSGQTELRELCRLPFPESTVRPVRFFADGGNSPTALDVRLSQIRLRADEIAAGLVQHEQTSTTGWWLAGAGVVILSCFLVVRHHQGKWPWREAE